MSEDMNCNEKQTNNSANSYNENSQPIYNSTMKPKSKNLKILALGCLCAVLFGGCNVVLVCLTVMLGGCNSLPHKDTVNELIKQNQQQTHGNYGVFEIRCTEIEYKNVKKVDNNLYTCKAIIHREIEQLKGGFLPDVVIQELTIEYVGDIVNVRFGEEIEIK